MESSTVVGWKERLQKRWDAFYLQWQIYSMTYFLEPWEKCLLRNLNTLDIGKSPPKTKDTCEKEATDNIYGQLVYAWY
uniref:Uncharacterized protein n=1 Tax=Anopheles quadriannulatus TaxID=34691 RepID=A0A182XJ19_ANOQN